jgi:uncharacterized membrane protein
MDAEAIQHSQAHGRGSHPRALGLLLLGVIFLGLLFRFNNLDRMVYSGDEVFTSMQISGYTSAEVRKQFANGRVLSVSDLSTYQYPRPDGSVADPVRALALEDSQHVPLYYMMLWGWVRAFGNSINVIRSFSAVTSVFALLGFWLLCRELFQSSWVSWLTLALIAVSPLHVVYAQEARPYSLYIVMTLLSSAALLRALRVETKAAWAIYTGTLILGVYTHTLFMLILGGHGVYVALLEQRLSRRLGAYVIAASLGFLSFVPWIWVIAHAPTKFAATKWASVQQEFFPLIKRWVGYVSRSFLDVGLGSRSDLSSELLWSPLILAILSLLAYALWFVYRHTETRVWLFILTLSGVTVLVFAIPDFVLGWQSATTRYLIPTSLGLQLAVSYVLAIKLQQVYERPSRYWRAITIMLISTEITSCIMVSNAEMWWNKKGSNWYLPQAAAIINGSKEPIVISDGGVVSVQMLGHALREKVHLQIVETTSSPEIPRGYSDVFLFNASKSMRSQLMEKYGVNVQNVVGPLWKISLPGNDVTRSGNGGLF